MAIVALIRLAIDGTSNVMNIFFLNQKNCHKIECSLDKCKSNSSTTQFRVQLFFCFTHTNDRGAGSSREDDESADVLRITDDEFPVHKRKAYNSYVLYWNYT